MPNTNIQRSHSTEELRCRLEQLRTQYRLLVIALGNVHDQLNEAGEGAWDGPLADTDELVGKNNWVALELAAGRNALMREGDALANEATNKENAIGSMDLAGRC
jgi:hypothetical protein